MYSRKREKKGERVKKRKRQRQTRLIGKLHFQNNTCMQNAEKRNTLNKRDREGKRDDKRRERERNE